MVYAILIAASFAAGVAVSALYFKRVVAAAKNEANALKQEADFYYDKWSDAVRATVAKAKKKL